METKSYNDTQNTQQSTKGLRCVCIQSPKQGHGGDHAKDGIKIQQSTTAEQQPATRKK